MRRVLLAVLVLALPSVASIVRAQGDPETSVAALGASGAAAEGAPARRPEQLDPAQPLTLRPEPSLRGLAQRAARTLALRTGVAVEVGDAPPPVVEAVPCAHVGMVRDGAELFVAFGAPQGMLYTSRVDLPGSRDAAVRAVALAVEALRDVAIEGPPPARDEGGASTEGGERVSYVYLEQEGGLFGVRRRTEPIAHPTIYLRLLLGFSTARSTALIGPGVGLGLCIEMSCVVIEGDLPVIPEERPVPSNPDHIVRYRPISFGLRAAIRPWRWGDFVPALVLGVLTRFGNAWIDADPARDIVGASQTVTDFGLRGSLELAWVFAAPFELVIELGVDFVANPAAFYRDGEQVLLEDVVTVWGVTSVRLRP